ncbi:hypothetical protein LMG18090_04037 [Ralstonia mannitolilytica]|uniref:hypothetical protein n=1 Tax=Ralstonia mannitolilytica TaxID=105219 RepID=UPI0007B0183A|nr:hypothetical protein [Ralstonia mannitolilytica]ANA34460.1 hypothetical protein VZ52_14265 [Ralstonia mannitolilytica]CAJ0800723.1 hypothetical protein LMG18090_04037 [Ralstonia mannitolilytica]
MTLQTTDLRIDWFRVFVQLKDEGYSLNDVSHFTDIPKSTLIGWKNGAEPKHSQGVCLLTFWAQATGHGSDEAPKVSPYDYRA